MKRKLTAAFAFCLVVPALQAAEQESTHLAGRENKAPGPPGYQQVDDNDKQFDRATEQAQRSLGFFIAALKAKKGGDSGFEIKKAFVDGENVEHLWISGVTYDGTNFHGKINNKPIDVKNVRLGGTVTVAPKDVTDWMFVKNGRLIGGYTTRVFYARLSPEQRAQFDQQADFKIEEKVGKK
jgi:uncharacterized protein YegJ (DUF2314 family)